MYTSSDSDSDFGGPMLDYHSMLGTNSEKIEGMLAMGSVDEKREEEDIYVFEGSMNQLLHEMVFTGVNNIPCIFVTEDSNISESQKSELESTEKSSKAEISKKYPVMVALLEGEQKRKIELIFSEQGLKPRCSYCPNSSSFFGWCSHTFSVLQKCIGRSNPPGFIVNCQKMQNILSGMNKGTLEDILFKILFEDPLSLHPFCCMIHDVTSDKGVELLLRNYFEDDNRTPIEFPKIEGTDKNPRSVFEADLNTYVHLPENTLKLNCVFKQIDFDMIYRAIMIHSFVIKKDNFVICKFDYSFISKVTFDEKTLEIIEVACTCGHPGPLWCSHVTRLLVTCLIRNDNFEPTTVPDSYIKRSYKQLGGLQVPVIDYSKLRYAIAKLNLDQLVTVILNLVWGRGQQNTLQGILRKYKDQNRVVEFVEEPYLHKTTFIDMASVKETLAKKYAAFMEDTSMDSSSEDDWSDSSDDYNFNGRPLNSRKFPHAISRYVLDLIDKVDAFKNNHQFSNSILLLESLCDAMLDMQWHVTVCLEQLSDSWKKLVDDLVVNLPTNELQATFQRLLTKFEKWLKNEKSEYFIWNATKFVKEYLMTHVTTSEELENMLQKMLIAEELKSADDLMISLSLSRSLLKKSYSPFGGIILVLKTLQSGAVDALHYLIEIGNSATILPEKLIKEQRKCLIETLMTPFATRKAEITKLESSVESLVSLSCRTYVRQLLKATKHNQYEVLKCMPEMLTLDLLSELLIQSEKLFYFNEIVDIADLFSKANYGLQSLRMYIKCFERCNSDSGSHVSREKEQEILKKFLDISNTIGMDRCMPFIEQMASATKFATTLFSMAEDFKDKNSIEMAIIFAEKCLDKDFSQLWYHGYGGEDLTFDRVVSFLLGIYGEDIFISKVFFLLSKTLQRKRAYISWLPILEKKGMHKLADNLQSIIDFGSKPSLSDYQIMSRRFGSEWPTFKEVVLECLQRSSTSDFTKFGEVLDILMQEEAFDRAASYAIDYMKHMVALPSGVVKWLRECKRLMSLANEKGKLKESNFKTVWMPLIEKVCWADIYPPYPPGISFSMIIPEHQEIINSILSMIEKNCTQSEKLFRANEESSGCSEDFPTLCS